MYLFPFLLLLRFFFNDTATTEFYTLSLHDALPITEADLPHVLALAHELRDAGLRAEYALGPQAVGRQLKLADARNARLAVVIGPDDRARGEVMVKDLAGKSQ